MTDGPGPDACMEAVAFLVTHRMSLGEAPRGYETSKKEDGCLRAAFTP